MTRLHWVPLSLAIMRSRLMWLYEQQKGVLNDCVRDGRLPRSYGLADMFVLPRKKPPEKKMSELEEIRTIFFEGPARVWTPDKAKLPQDEASSVLALRWLRRIYTIMFGGM